MVAFLLQLVLGAIFLLAGIAKLFRFGPPTRNWPRLRLPGWFLSVTGMVEVFAGIGVFVGLALPIVTLPVGFLLVATMFGALLAHARVHDAPRHFFPAMVLLVLAGIDIAINWSHLSLLLY